MSSKTLSHETLNYEEGGGKRSPRAGFALAEVLITLGIIGIVTAVTIPTLITNYNQRTWNTGATVFEKKLEDSLKIMNSQSTLAGHTTTESFVEELSKHFKTNKICQKDELISCFSNVIYWGSSSEEIDMNTIKTSRHIGQKSWKTNLVGVQFANGTNSLIAYNPNCEQDPHSNQITGQDCLAILYDTSGKKSPNTSGKDLRANRNVTRLGSDCFAEINDVCLTMAAFTPTPVSRDECNRMKSTHGIKACNYYSDTWAGAVKQCGGVSKMASAADLAKIANYVYNTNKVSQSSSISNLTFDTNKASKLGLPSPTFYVWSNSEGSASSSGRRGFTASSTASGSNVRNQNHLAICIDD